MEETIEKLADSILDIVDGYANLDHLGVPSWDNKDITEYEALKIAVTNEIKGYVDKLEKENEELKEWAEENSYLKAENKKLGVENRKLRIELSAYDREYFDEDKKAAFIFSDFGGYDEDVAN